MEIKAQLIKPYTEEQRIEFIVEQNHRIGYKIEEQEDALVALGYTEEEISFQEKQQRVEELKQQLNEIDLKSIRAVCDGDADYLEKYRNEAKVLREEIRKLINKEEQIEEVVEEVIGE